MMERWREDLHILFFDITPERIWHTLRECAAKGISSGYFVQLQNLILDAYERHDGFRYLTLDEIRMRQQYFMQNTEEHSREAVFFAMLYQQTDRMLRYQEKEPVCRFEEIRQWRETTGMLGQDIFITAWMAHRDVVQGIKNDQRFDWPYCIHSDNDHLNAMLSQGLAENHFHLNGSTQIFPLSWACLMNHPALAGRFIREGRRFRRNLGDTAVLDNLGKEEANEKTWIRRIEYAAVLRSLLFMRLLQMKNGQQVMDDYLFFDALPNIWHLPFSIPALRFSYGTIYPESNACLDYMVCNELYQTDVRGYNRLLEGERAFLYHCFWKLFSGEWKEAELGLFYAYLVTKNYFRTELVQVNKRMGFENFLRYQDRKEQFFESIKAYQMEAQRLAIWSSAHENHIRSMECRLMPKESRAALVQKIRSYDKMIYQQSMEGEECEVFYVLHFAKKPFDIAELNSYGKRFKEIITKPRNFRVRELARKQAAAIWNVKTKNESFQSTSSSDAGHEGIFPLSQKKGTASRRICGIDACSSEIGCRPETFATEFRALRSWNDSVRERGYSDDISPKSLGVTYHVGEDFLDICDGMRAVDEALIYLGMQRGDRIGHGMVLGIDPHAYYGLKRHLIYLPQQDYLDNCIWLLKRSRDWDIELKDSQREKLRKIAVNLIRKLYGKYDSEIEKQKSHELTESYYESWLLRGDEPSLYQTGKYIPARETLGSVFNKYYKNENNLYVDDRELDAYRRDATVASLLYLYHFDYQVKQKGQRTVSIPVEPWAAGLMEQFQDKLQNILSEKGIAIECNPTSNLKIGAFGEYVRHPIFRFYDNGLTHASGHAQLQVSINTDDLGVFDTSLSYEYALLADAMLRNRHEKELYDDENVYLYFDRIRKNGFDMSFGGVKY